MRKLTALLLALLICLPLSGLAEEQKDLTTVRMTLVGDCILGSDEPLHSEKDSLVGTHPHVLQGIEVYKNRLIFYSLGNFVFGGNKNPLSDKKTAKQIPTALMSVELQFDQNQLYSTQFTIHPYYETGDEQINNYQPVPVTGDKAQRVMDILQSDTPFTLNPFIEGEGAVQDIIYANDQH